MDWTPYTDTPAWGLIELYQVYLTERRCQEELEYVAGDTEVWNDFLSLLPLWIPQEKQTERKGKEWANERTSSPVPGKKRMLLNLIF